MTYRPGSIMMPMPSHRPLMEYGLYSVSVYALQLTLSSCCIVGPLHSKDINMVVQIEFSTVAKCMQRSAVNVEKEEDGERGYSTLKMQKQCTSAGARRGTRRQQQPSKDQ